jgi:vancomycin resistance protein YoaR
VAQYNIDLRLRNPYQWPVRIEAETGGDAVVIRILSQRPIGRDISVEREIRQVTPPGEVVRSSAAGSNIRWRVINHGQPGLRVAVYRRVTEGANSVRTLVSEDTYPPMNRVIKGD